ncbi:MAG: pentapeptide repeat-containing protein [Nitrospirales bacterium]
MPSSECQKNNCVWMRINSGKPCPLHDHSVEKDWKNFSDALLEVLEARESTDRIRLDGAIFPEGWVGMHGEPAVQKLLTLDRPVSFRKAIFRGTVNFSYCKFKQEVFFDGAIFEGETFFGEFVFRKLASFDSSEFHGPVHFKFLMFNDVANFRKAIFYDDVDFSPMSISPPMFGNAAFFNEAELRGHVIFDNVAFKEKATFDGAKFSGEALFNQNDVLKVGELMFEGGASFKEAEFQGKSVFDGIGFKGEANFDKVKVMEETSFVSTVFNDEARFRDAIFKESCSFNQTQFNKKVEFEGASFDGTVIFRETEFKADVFMGAYFTRARFIGTKDKLLFTDGKKNLSVSFKGAVFIQPHFIQFKDVNFSKAILLESDMRGIDFHGVTWPTEIVSGGIRNFQIKCLYEPSKTEPKVLESTYRQIRQSYEDRRNYPEAGDFYYWEMENKLKQLSVFGKYFSLTWWYKVSSGYGQRPLQAFGVLLILLYVFNVLIILSGLSVDKSVQGSSLGFFSVFFSYTLKIVTFGSPSYFRPESIFGEFIATVARLVVPTQAALFVLAVNRAFRR